MRFSRMTACRSTPPGEAGLERADYRKHQVTPATTATASATIKNPI
jgi:hypothetical protein